MSYETEPSLLSWMRTNLDETDNELIYKDAGTKQMCFFRDYIATIFLDPQTHYETANHFCHIGGFHRSKSVRLPVYHIKTDHVEVWARDNFYNWNVTVVADREIDIPDFYHIDAAKDYLFMEGMDDKRKPIYAENKQEFSFCLWGGEGKYLLYAIMRIVASHFPKYLPPAYVVPGVEQGARHGQETQAD